MKNLQQKYDELLEAVKWHHGQRADDRCIYDDDRIYDAAGLPQVDRHIGDPDAMLVNCARFIRHRCLPGKWPSYVELEQEIVALKTYIAQLEEELVKYR